MLATLQVVGVDQSIVYCFQPHSYLSASPQCVCLLADSEPLGLVHASRQRTPLMIEYSLSVATSEQTGFDEPTIRPTVNVQSSPDPELFS